MRKEPLGIRFTPRGAGLSGLACWGASELLGGQSLDLARLASPGGARKLPRLVQSISDPCQERRPDPSANTTGWQREPRGGGHGESCVTADPAPCLRLQGPAGRMSQEGCGRWVSVPIPP